MEPQLLDMQQEILTKTDIYNMLPRQTEDMA